MVSQPKFWTSLRTRFWSCHIVAASHDGSYRKTCSEQIYEPSQAYEFHSISNPHIENMIILFHTVPWWNPIVVSRVWDGNSISLISKANLVLVYGGFAPTSPIHRVQNNSN
jgi:hypothetical protein